VDDLQAQRDALNNYAEINRVIKQEEVTPHLEFSDEVSARPSSPKAKKQRKRSKSPKSKGTQKDKVEKPTMVQPEPAQQPATPVTPVRPENVEPNKNEFEKPTAASSHDANNDQGQKSGLTLDDLYALLSKRIGELEEKQRKDDPPKTEADPKDTSTPTKAQKARDRPMSRGVTPGRLAAENFFAKVLKEDAPKARRVKTDPPPSDPSDDSSSSSDESSNSLNPDGSGSPQRSASPRLSSKRKRGHTRKQRMILKPIPPSRYNGEPNANAIQRFAREAKTYVKMGRVAEHEQVYFISYYLDAKALDFYIKS
jgi:hypothetical protein